MFLKRFLITIILTVGFIFLFAFIIRIFNNKQGLVSYTDPLTGKVEYYQRGYLGFSDFVSFVENVDLISPLQDVIDDFNDVKDSWSNVSKTIHFDNKTGIAVGGVVGGIVLPVVGSAIGALVATTDIPSLVQAVVNTIVFPFKIVFDLCKMLVGYFAIIGNFITWLVASDGYTLTPTTI